MLSLSDPKPLSRTYKTQVLSILFVYHKFTKSNLPQRAFYSLYNIRHHLPYHLHVNEQKHT